MKLATMLLQWSQAHEGLLSENAILIFTAFLYNSPVPKGWLLLWVRKSLFAIFNRNHPPDTADPKA